MVTSAAPPSALFTDLYQLTMLQAYEAAGLREEAVFDLFVRRLRHRNYLLHAGLETILDYLEGLRVTAQEIDYLAGLDLFTPDFLEHLRTFRFTGEVYAMPEGTAFFAGEPVLQVVAPLGQAQLVETFLLNQFTVQTGLCSKASRVVDAAQGRPVIDFGMRRMHGADAALTGARAFQLAGVSGTSNVLAGLWHGLPVRGTMAHSFIQAFEDEERAFETFATLYPKTTLLVDTYDTLQGVERVIRLAHNLSPAHRPGAIRLDSGDLGALAREARRRLDAAGLTDMRIVASNSLDEHTIHELVEAGVPIDGFGVGTRMGTMADQPYLDSVYKLSAYADTGRMKMAANKSNLPGRKQVYRQIDQGQAVADIIAREGEAVDGTPLLVQVMHEGQRTAAGRATLAEIKERVQVGRNQLPAPLRGPATADPPYPVTLSPGLEAYRAEVRTRLESR
ncbi:MAG: nicotinate phosphoribosyltransferase [Bacteroidota bacterium]